MDLFSKISSRKTMGIGIVLLVILLVILAFFVDWTIVIAMLTKADRPMLAAGLVLLVLGYISYAERWRYLLQNRPGYWSVFHAANAGTMVNTLLPGRPGDPARIILLGGKTGLPIFSITSSVVVERWFEQIMRLAALGGAVIFGAGAHVSFLTILGSVIYLIGSFLLMIILLRRREWVLAKAPAVIARLPRIEEEQARRWLNDLIIGLAGVSRPGRLLAALLWSLSTWILFWGYHFLCLAALHADLSINQLLAISLGSLGLVPPSATTVPGVYQVSLVVPMTLVGYNRDLLTGYALVLNLVEMTVVLLLGAWGTFATGLTLHQLFNRAGQSISQSFKATQPPQ